MGTTYVYKETVIALGIVVLIFILIEIRRRMIKSLDDEIEAILQAKEERDRIEPEQSRILKFK